MIYRFRINNIQVCHTAQLNFFNFMLAKYSFTFSIFLNSFFFKYLLFLICKLCQLPLNTFGPFDIICMGKYMFWKIPRNMRKYTYIKHYCYYICVVTERIYLEINIKFKCCCFLIIIYLTKSSADCNGGDIIPIIERRQRK